VLEQNRTVEVEVELENTDVGSPALPGTSADVEIILDRRDDVLRIPSSAVAEGGSVLVLDNGVLQERTIESGLRNWRYVEVVSGLREGEIVVAARNLSEIKPGARAKEKGK
jgi:HlyD family secretion protein